MTPKKVWSVIIIVLGIVFFLYGVKTYNETSFVGNEIRDMGQQLSRAGYGQLLDSKRYERLIENEKVKGVLLSVLGIAMAIGGTMMLSEKKKKYVPRNRSLDLDDDPTLF